MSTLNGDSTNNVLTGTSSSDLISGGAGSDTISGGSGSDLISGGSGNDVVLAGNGNDLVFGGSGNDYIDGGNGNDILSGGAGNDVILGGAGSDLLSGDSGNDVLKGGAGNDVLSGGSGNDVLVGNEGTDWLQGGSGNDLFAYLQASDSNIREWDRIVDFQQGKDKIDLSALLGPTTDLAWGNQAFGVWQAYSGSGCYNSSTFVYADVDGDSKADLKIELTNTRGLVLNQWDFLGVGTSPMASNSAAQGFEDTDITGRMVAIDPDGGSLNYFVVDGPAHGKLVLNGDGSFCFTPDENFNGSDRFTFKANDGSSDSNVATVMLTVNAVNDAPVAQTQSGVVGEDAMFSGTLAATDVDGDSLTYSIVAPVDGVTVNPDGSFSVTPQASDQGLDDGESHTVTFQYVANDGKVNSAPATVSVTINGANDAPVAQNFGVSTDENSQLSDKLVASDVDQENLSYKIVAPVDGVTVDSSGAFQFDPGNLYDYLGEGASTDVSFQFVANDGTVDSAPATVTIHITGVNDNPVAVDDVSDLNTSVGAAGNVLTDLASGDADPDNGDTLTVTSLGGKTVDGDVFVLGKYGHILMTDDGQWAYTLTDAPAQGDDEVFNYTIADDHGASDSAQLTIHVTGTGVPSTTSSTIELTSADTLNTGTDSSNAGGAGGSGSGSGGNNAPVAVADEANWNNGGISGNLLANDSDPDLGDSLVVTAVNGNSDGLGDLAFGDYGFLMLTDTGDWTYQLGAAGTDVLSQGGTADDVFGYTIADASGAAASSTLTVHIGDFIL